MQTSGLVIHLAGAHDSPVPELRLAGLTLGERVDRRLPAVLEAEDDRASIEAVRALESDPAIARVDVVFVGTDERIAGARTCTSIDETS